MNSKDNRPAEAAPSINSGQALSRYAENITGEKTAQLPKSIDALSPEENRQLHELQVHKIELEMQNDELRRVQEQLETERARVEQRTMQVEQLANEQRFILSI